VLKSPSDGRERAVSNALLLEYYGVYLPPPLEAVVSPNGDGVADAQRLAFKVVRPSTVSVTLTAPTGVVTAQAASPRSPGTYKVAFPPVPAPPPAGQPAPAPTTTAPAEGRWTLTVNATDDQGLASTATQRFAVNSTLGFLRVSPARVAVRKAGASVAIRWTQTRAARVKVTIATPQGVVVRTVTSAALPAGERAVTWNGLHANRKPVAGAPYVVSVTATNELGSVSLAEPIVVRRVKG
jgi:hypothetical protein